MTVEPLLTAREVADLFQFNGPAYVLRKARPTEADPMPCYRMGATFGPVRFRASEVETWLGKRRQKVAS